LNPLENMWNKNKKRKNNVTAILSIRRA